jgi:hypothetical protein
MKVFTILLFTIFIASCFPTKQNKTENHIAKSNSIEYKFDLSLHTKIFLHELEKEKKGKENNNFIPSDKLIDKYNIMIENDIYTMSGFIKTQEGYSENDLTKLNIKTNSKIGKIITVIIPLSSIDNFLKLDGIKYFEINKKVELKNN